MAEIHYLFIDGGYLRARHSDAIKAVFGESGDLNFSPIRYLHPSGLFQRVFYYDCLHDIPKVDETEGELKTRIDAQQTFFDGLQALEGFHVRLGSLSGTSRRFRQKEVDILLAVDVLEHAFHKNITSVTLIAGDLDFAPLVEALVRLGTWVEIWYDMKSFGKHLLEVADKRTVIGFHNYYNWTTNDFRQGHALPQCQNNITFDPQKDPQFHLLKSGTFENLKVRLYQRDKEYVLFVSEGPNSRLFTHADAAVLENYFAITYSKVTWE